MYHHKRLPQCAMPSSKTSGFSNSCGKSTMNWRNKRAPVDVHVAVCFTKPTFPRKPRGCPSQMRADYESRLSFCCATCRKRCTSMSVRFLGRRVYLGLVVVLASVRRDGQTPVTARLSQMLEVPLRTLQRWRQWWCELFPLTTLWQAMCARFMPAVVIALLPASLLERFGNSSGQALTRLLVFLSPLTVSAAVGLSITLRAGS